MNGVIRSIIVSGLIVGVSAMTGCMPKSQLDKAANLFVQNRCQEAIAVCDKALARDPGNTELWKLRAEANSSLENWNEAIADYTHLLELEPKDWDIYLRRADLYQQLGDLAACEADRKRGEELDTSRETALLVEPRYQVLLGRNAGSREDPDGGDSLSADKGPETAAHGDYLSGPANEFPGPNRSLDRDADPADEAPGNEAFRGIEPSVVQSPIPQLEKPVIGDPLQRKKDDAQGNKNRQRPPADRAGRPGRLDELAAGEDLPPEPQQQKQPPQLGQGEQSPLTPDEVPPVRPMPFRWNQFPGATPLMPPPRRVATGIRADLDEDEGKDPAAGRERAAPLVAPWGPLANNPAPGPTGIAGVPPPPLPGVPTIRSTGIRSGDGDLDEPVNPFGHGQFVAPRAFGTPAGMLPPIGGGVPWTVRRGLGPQPIPYGGPSATLEPPGTNFGRPMGSSGSAGLSGGTGTMAPLPLGRGRTTGLANGQPSPVAGTQSCRA